jgi:hypothetical protein
MKPPDTARRLSRAQGGDKTDLKNPPHLESVVEVNRDEAEVWGRRRCSVDESKMRLRFGQIRGDDPDLVSSIPRQLAFSPMMIFAFGEHAPRSGFMVTFSPYR